MFALYSTDVSLPAVFMPSKGRDLTIFNPRASKYFHATGKGTPHRQTHTHTQTHIMRSKVVKY